MSEGNRGIMRRGRGLAAVFLAVGFMTACGAHPEKVPDSRETEDMTEKDQTESGSPLEGDDQTEGKSQPLESGQKESVSDSEADRKADDQNLSGEGPERESGTEADGGRASGSGQGGGTAGEAGGGLPEYLRGVDLTGDEAVRHEFSEVTVHDPSVIKVEDTWYVFGSHLAAAKTEDLMNWTLIDSGVRKGNAIIPDAKEEMQEAFEWAQTDTFWAPDVIQLVDGRFYMYYCNCEGSKPRSALGIAVADQVEGPYEDLGIILKSGQGRGDPDEEGGAYDARVEPNVVDPCVFFDASGRLWMMYGSYSGGIYILELDPETGFPLEGGYGKKLLGGNHLRIEGSYVVYSPETKYYYMFLSFGGLTADGGYNIRVCRSENPDGPYFDSEGQDMIECKGGPGSFFDDSKAQEYGVKLMGGFSFSCAEGENGKTRSGYVSPGHNSVWYEEETGQYFLIFHTRFQGTGEMHQVRVHQMFLNEDGWPVVSPYRYAGERLEPVDEAAIPGAYKLVSHGHDISAEVKISQDIVLGADHSVSGSCQGTWELKGEHGAVLLLDGVEYKGEWILEWDQFGQKNVMTFTALSAEGCAVWGSGYEAR